MKALAKLKCSLQSRESLESFYGRLSVEELRSRKKNLPLQYLIPVSIWLSSVLLFSFSNMQIELLVAYAVSITGVFVSLYVDFRKRKKTIEDLLADRK